MSEELKPEPLSESHVLEILATAICDVGYWSWWITDLPAIIQIEFRGTQLYFPPTDITKPPNSQIAIQFRQPKSISFLSKQVKKEGQTNWYDDLHQDKMEPPHCNYGQFSFTHLPIMKEILTEAKQIETIFGYAPTDQLFETEKYKLVFWANNYGLAVAAEEIQIVTMDGKIALEQIPELHGSWWTYWKKYWELKDSADALPIDYACEVTIPLKN